MKRVEEWRKALESGEFDRRLEELYLDVRQIPAQKERYLSLLEAFREQFGELDVEAEFFSAPGRSEIAGNHTDHQQGEVLAASVNLDALAIAAPTKDNRIRIVSEGYGEMELKVGDDARREEERGTSLGLVRGVLAALGQQGYTSQGFVASLTSNVLNGAGLSSSAAFEVLIGHIVSGLFYQSKIDPVFLAKAAQYAENEYFGKPCGLMDQMACSVGGMIHIDFADKENPLVKKLPLRFASYGYSLCIVDTKGNHADLTEDYAAIPAEMKAVAAAVGKTVLREVAEEAYFSELPKLRETFGDRPLLRAFHFFAENRRVEEQAAALKQGDFQKFLGLVQESGDSSFRFLQNVYSNQDVQNQSVSVALAVSEALLRTKSGCHGVCRVHGGGFAGTIQAFVEDTFVEEYRRGIEAVFGKGACHILKVRADGGTVCFPEEGAEAL